MELHVQSIAENAITIIVGDQLNEAVRERVMSLYQRLQHATFLKITDCVPAMTSVTVYYESRFPTMAHQVRDQLSEWLLHWERSYDEAGSRDLSRRVIELPVCYGGVYGPDLNYVAEYAQLTVEEVIELHTSPEYPVHMLGFAPGFPYLGGMSKRISTPRKSVPRAEVAAGSVGIAGEQTGIYSVSMPGGWQIIGRTPLQLFNPYLASPTLLSAGDFVKFVAMKEQEFSLYEEEFK